MYDIVIMLLEEVINCMNTSRTCDSGMKKYWIERAYQFKYAADYIQETFDKEME